MVDPHHYDCRRRRLEGASSFFDTRRLGWAQLPCSAEHLPPMLLYMPKVKLKGIECLRQVFGMSQPEEPCFSAREEDPNHWAA